MLNKRLHYLQVALNSTLEEARTIISALPRNERILIEAGTPLIKTYGLAAIENLRQWWEGKLQGSSLFPISTVNKTAFPYIVADLKAMDRGETEVQLAKRAGASAAVVLGQAPLETIDSFIDSCAKYGLDAMVDMMNVGQPYKILRKLRKLPHVVVLHRGVDEEKFNPDKPIPYWDISKIKGTSDVMITIAGGDTIREVQRSVFNGADIVVVWKEFYQASSQTGVLAEEFLKKIK